MDRQNRGGAKPGGAQFATKSEAERARKERLNKLTMETVDISKDPYIFRNHLGSYECKLCNTQHATENSYLSHTQGKKH